MKTIHESGVDFGPYREEELFHIEGNLRHINKKRIVSLEFAC